MLLGVLSSFLPGFARAQAPCEEAKQRIYRITETEAQHMPDSLQTVLDLASFIRECEEERSLELEQWLLINETFAFDGLGHYEEAAGIVEHFFNTYFERATDYYQARFYLWRLHFYTLSGNGVRMVVDYLEARRYAAALDVTRQAHLHLNGAYAYREIREYGKALTLVDEAKGLIGQPETYEDSVALARAVRDGAETQLRLGTRLEGVTADLQYVSGLYATLGDTANIATSRTLLGETHAAAGDTSAALAEVAEGVRLARQSGGARSLIAALYRQGQLLRQRRDFEAARQSLMEARRASETVKEFSFRILYELARLHEQRRNYDQASSYYQTIIDAPKPGNSFAGELEAAQRAREGRNRVLLIRADHRFRLALFGSVFGFLLLIGLAGAGYFLHVRRREAIIDQLRSATVIPKNLHTGLTLEQLEQRYQKLAGLDLFGTRLAYIFAVLFEPDLVRPYIKDAYLLRQVEADRADRVADNAALFECSAAVEEALKGTKFRGRAANTLRSYLSTEFGKRDWPWPKSPLAWKLFFLEQHAKVLF